MIEVIILVYLAFVRLHPGLRDRSTEWIKRSIEFSGGLSRCSGNWNWAAEVLRGLELLPCEKGLWELSLPNLEK